MNKTSAENSNVATGFGKMSKKSMNQKPQLEKQSTFMKNIEISPTAL
jgi:hypothetical protein